MKTYFYKAVICITLGFLSSACIAEPVFAIEATIYKLENNITIDSQVNETLKNLQPIHQPQLLASLNKSALIEIGDDEQLTALEIKTNKEGSYFNASMKLKEKVDSQWESITSFMPNIPNGQTVYFSRTFADNVWVIKLTGQRYESIALGQASFK
ncbi:MULTISPECIES: hypothetical protein [unclassified Pseudoalteromonas]|uniref:hypothetical protein n=1 Tax=unclassified Pseudoalteromonas TaxID=194690 RepID=UPI001601D92D|nr:MULTISPECIES: hypothetical protein [unclassified Pseudoalteromonas]MBB1310234.1 hypothetical protein [Pseudoalteromonas sp. SR41-8]MBB1409990.1 hypothetical protein [Pseudoalteromonas sp. SG44-17]|tara:strand:- start:222 stop:686 length:465 start_codon:yes stop_codon:yes gene_type:complete